jgi:hypothetical protein
VQLSDLKNYVSRIFTPPPKIHTRLTIVIPSLADVRNCTQADKVHSQCQLCAKLLASHLYVWRKSFPERTTVKQWGKKTMSFTGMNIEDFQNFLMANFKLKTMDGREWLLDKTIADHIWQACVAENSPLPLASWNVAMDLKRKAVR